MIWTRPLSLSVCFLFSFSQLLSAQQAAAPAVQPQLLAQKSLAALVGATSLSDITLSGSARRIAGSDDETGAVTVKASVSSGCRVDLNLPSGQRTETRSISKDGATGSWSGPDRAAHPVASHNLMTDSGLVPSVVLANLLSSSNSAFVFVGQETRGTVSVLHLSASQQFPALAGHANTAALMHHLSHVDIFLDAATLLPVALAFNIHPDDNALLDIPIEIRFSDYRAVSTSGVVAALPASRQGLQTGSSVLVPFHVQKFLNNGLILDLQFQSASINSGLPASDFSLP